MPTFLKYLFASVIGAAVACVTLYRFSGDRAGGPDARAASREGERVAAPADIAAEARPAREDLLRERERLARELEELQARLDAARGELARSDAALRRSEAQLADLRRPMEQDLYSSALRAELRSGEVIVTGGYRLADGRRLYAFARPVVQPEDGTIRIDGDFLTLTEDTGRLVGLDSLATNAANTIQHGEVWVPGEMEEVMAAAGDGPGTSLVSYPAATVRPGDAASIEVDGLRLKITPTLHPDGDNMEVDLRLEQPQEPAGGAGEAEAKEALPAGDVDQDAPGVGR